MENMNTVVDVQGKMFKSSLGEIFFVFDVFLS